MGHGWVKPNPDGSKARCGGPNICRVCMVEKARLETSQEKVTKMPNLATVNSVYFVERYDTSTQKWRSVLIEEQGENAGKEIALDSEEVAYKTATNFMQAQPNRKFRVVKVLYETLGHGELKPD